MNRRWRPSLALVLGGGLAGTLALSLAGLVALRYLGPAIGFRTAALALGAAITAATIVLGWLMIRLLLRPIRALEQYAKAQEQAAPPPPPRHFGTRELHVTARQVIAMAEALSDREATIRAFTDHVTHELKTPVSAIRAAVELIEDGGTLPDTDRHLLAQIDSARQQMEAQLAALRAAARAREVRYLGQSCLADILPGLVAAHPTLTFDVKGDRVAIPIAADGLAMALHQLAQNAADHGARTLRVSVDQGGQGCDLHVGDDGRGISAGNAPRIFDPFFSTRRDQGGTGMGLTVVRTLLQAHRADILLVPGETGATFRLNFRAQGS